MELTTPGHGLADIPEPMFDWQPDSERLEREVQAAEFKGKRDDLTLAEIECSLDLLEAELAALRRHGDADLVPSRPIRERTAIRGKLLALARRLERLPA